jgi:hypothetical protein
MSSTHVSGIPVYEKGGHLVGIGVTLRATCSQACTPGTKVSIRSIRYKIVDK